MKILVIGGSYFYGRVFVMLAAKEHDVTVVNRGTYSMEALGVRQIRGERHDKALWRSCAEEYDVIVDFCAYEKGDIAGVLRNMAGRAAQYIFISTVDVYRRGTGGLKTEETPFETRELPGEAGSYIRGKTALEQEVREECAERGMQYTVLRPAVLYGPYNYAPRESVFIRLMVQDRILPHIVGTDGAFQFVYVKDAAEAVLRCLLNPAAYGQAYNLCQEQAVTYDIFFDVLKGAADVEFNEIPLTAGAAGGQGIPLPFPVTAQETELYSGEKSRRELALSYTELPDGMARTYRAFKGVYKMD